MRRRRCRRPRRPGMKEVQEMEAGGTEGRNEVDLPNFSKRQLSTFEAVFLT